jgi:hypothetical protein
VNAPLPLTGIHPKALEAAQKAEARRLEEAKMRDFTAQWKKVYDLHFIHVRPGAGQDGKMVFAPNGGVTLAWSPTRPTHRGNHKPTNIVAVATALCCAGDRFCKWQGEFYAARNFNWGRTVEVFVPIHDTVGFLSQMFRPSTFLMVGRTVTVRITAPQVPAK